jgi:hypothetical protein
MKQRNNLNLRDTLRRFRLEQEPDSMDVTDIFLSCAAITTSSKRSSSLALASVKVRTVEPFLDNSMALRKWLLSILLLKYRWQYNCKICERNEFTY